MKLEDILKSLEDYFGLKFEKEKHFSKNSITIGKYLIYSGNTPEFKEDGMIFIGETIMEQKDNKVYFYTNYKDTDFRIIPTKENEYSLYRIINIKELIREEKLDTLINN